MSAHPVSYERLVAYAAGELNEAEFVITAAHVAACSECAQTVARLRLIQTLLPNDFIKIPPPATLARAKAIFTEHRAPRRSKWLNLNQIRRNPIKEIRFAASALGWRILILAFLMGGMGLVVAAQEALPGDVLYEIKTTVENVRVAISPDHISQAQLHLSFAQTRLHEIAALTAKGRKNEIPAAVSAYRGQIQAAIISARAATDADANQGPALSRTVNTALSSYSQDLNTLRDQSPYEIKPLISDAISISVMARLPMEEQLPQDLALLLGSPTAIPTAPTAPAAVVEGNAGATWTTIPSRKDLPPATNVILQTALPVPIVTQAPAATAITNGIARARIIWAPIATFFPIITQTPTAAPTLRPSATSTARPTETPLPTDTAAAIPAPTNTPTETSTPTSTSTYNPTPTPTYTSTPTGTPTATPSDTPTATPTDTPTPTSTLVTPPVQGSSLSFDGVNDVVRTVDLPFSTAFTVEAWVKRTTDSGIWQAILSDATSDFSQATFLIYVDAGNQACTGANDQFVLYQTGDQSELCSGQTAMLDVWYHIAVSRNRNGLTRFFVNGVLKRVFHDTSDPTDSNGILTLGRAGDYADGYFSGLIDEVRISNAAIYTTTFIPPVMPLNSTTRTLALWHLDEGVGQVILDSSGHGRHGTLAFASGPDTAGPIWSIDTPVIIAAPTPTPTQTWTPTPSDGFMGQTMDTPYPTEAPVP